MSMIRQLVLLKGERMGDVVRMRLVVGYLWNDNVMGYKLKSD